MISLTFDKSKIPHKSGVYIFKDKFSKVLYVGKAIDLYHRVAAYFSGRAVGKTAVLVSQIDKVDTIIVESELEALILEANLIKKYKPPFNIRLIDDRDYLYIGITKDEFPKILTLRAHDLKKMKKFWGPFPSGRTVRDTLKQLRRVFPWCSGSGKRPCFYYHIGLCPGSCAGVTAKNDYRRIIRRFSMLLDGKKKELIEELSAEMQFDSENLKFEEAAKLKKVIEGINYLTQVNRTRLYLENPNFLANEAKLALEELQHDLNLPKLPKRIEGFDISNLQGKKAVGSMVVLTDGEIDKSEYRRFKIKLEGKPNDVGMHKEMARRRLKNDWPVPDLIIVDGGRAQARAVQLEIGNWKLDIPVFGLAKRMEWLYPPTGEVIKLSKNSLSLRLLQKLRDESHRFAINYHRKLYRKSFLPSV